MNKFAKLKDNNTFIHDVEQSFETRMPMIGKGIYKIKNFGGLLGPTKYGFELFNKEIDNLISFKEGIVNETIERVKDFFSEKTISLYKEMKVCHKVGMLLHGPPGTGKTSTVMLIMKELVDNLNCICLICTDNNLNFIMGAINLLRKEGYTGPICLFIDEVEDAFSSELGSYLTFLDGEKSVEGLIFIGCTNHINEIPDKIKYRKSRIKHLIEINRFPDTVYQHYIKEKIPSLNDKEVIEIAYKAGEANLTIDQLKHVLVDHRLENIPLDKAIQEVKKHIVQED